MKQDAQKITQSLPEGWQCLHGQESWGDQGHTGVLVVVKTPVEVSEARVPDRCRIRRRGHPQ